MPSKTVSSTRVDMTEIMTPNDANFLGKVFGGAILSKVDLCAYVTASRFSGEVCVTASFDRVDFHEPVEVGEVVTMTGMVSFVGRTSVEVTIEVYAENIFKNTHRHTNTARVTTVAIKEGRPVEVPRLICETRDEKVRFLEGRIRREARGRHQEELEAIMAEIRSSSDEDIETKMAAPRIV